MMKKNQWVITMFLISVMILTAAPSRAEEKTWTGSGDAKNWFGDENWSPLAAPLNADDVVINSESASALLSSTFNAKTITLGGNTPSALTMDEFVSGAVTPATTSDIALLNRKDGHLILKGTSGTMVVRGSYKDSEEVLTDQPSLVVWVS